MRQTRAKGPNAQGPELHSQPLNVGARWNYISPVKWQSFAVLDALFTTVWR